MYEKNSLIKKKKKVHAKKEEVSFLGLNVALDFVQLLHLLFNMVLAMEVRAVCSYVSPFTPGYSLRPWTLFSVI